MYELIRASEKAYYIQSPAKIGLVKLSDTEVCLIDSGKWNAKFENNLLLWERAD